MQKKGRDKKEKKKKKKRFEDYYNVRRNDAPPFLGPINQLYVLHNNL